MSAIRPRPLTAGLVLALGTSSLQAQQTDPSEGPALVLAQGFSVDGASVIPGAGPGTLLLTRSDFSDTAPDPWVPAPGMPDFSAMLGGLPLDLDAFSIGLDYIQSTPNGLAVIPPGHWAAITFSVTRGTVGTAGGRIAYEAVRPGGAAADVFFYVLPGSALPSGLVDRTMRSQDSDEISAQPTGVSGNIDAHDLYVGLFYRDNPQLVAVLPFQSVFFSVTAAAVPLVPSAWWGAAPASGATILRRDWIGGAWTPVQPAFTPADFGLGAGEDVDALAVDLLRGHVLFSTTRPAATPGAPLRDPVLYHRIGTPGNFVYCTSAGNPPIVQPVSTRLGLSGPGGIDDVDGVCALDPGPGSQPPLSHVIGTPQQRIYPAPARIAVAVSRRRSPGGSTEEFVATMSGWPIPNTPNPGLAFVGVNLGMPTNPYVTAATFYRPNTGSPYHRFAGHPERYVLVLPGNPVFLGVQVNFVGAVFDVMASVFDVSFPVAIRV
ncbi:MAG: hypothetical protein FJ265_12850 [Planctomycetes bacterium]|nr:hypothetical protein [Planctomycetota bacterium]